MRQNIFQSWKKQCDYYPFDDKVKMKELADKNMVLKARELP